ncbi:MULTISPECIES: DnaJ domain-containing protein [Marinobacter]|uniref:Molecular chaperone DnaJ n=1 Tax=Marinobacter profundi TaxID=2666256 RepID=A0A2G1UI92_9GAMM|nr:MULTISPECIES: DnaJ domain-containing protein [Marinobacter]MBD3658059.1 DnaJ domain-containing protein [Marinobacter sp.]PHQ14165.1 molecular chaperone DnaJ [Marinobacter profundi]
MQWIIGIALAAAVFVILKKWGALTPEGKKAATWKFVAVIGGALLLFMVLTGRVHVLTAAVAALIPLLRKAPALLRLLSLAGRRDQPGASGTAGDGAGAGQHQRAAASSTMSRREACEILGVDEDCSADEVVTAHRRLMQKIHPDRGGNDYLAAKVNEAKSVLLGRRS